MSKPPNGSPAFPGRAQQTSGVTGQTKEVPTAGMTLRDYFATAALTGIIQAHAGSKNPKEGEVAEDAYRVADAMLAEREKTQA